MYRFKHSVCVTPRTLITVKRFHEHLIKQTRLITVCEIMFKMKIHQVNTTKGTLTALGRWEWTCMVVLGLSRFVLCRTHEQMDDYDHVLVKVNSVIITQRALNHLILTKCSSFTQTWFKYHLNLCFCFIRITDTICLFIVSWCSCNSCKVQWCLIMCLSCSWCPCESIRES